MRILLFLMLLLLSSCKTTPGSDIEIEYFLDLYSNGVSIVW